MTKCQNGHLGINSTYIREGVNGSLKKIGYYCNTCNIHYGIDKKLYTVNEKVYTVSRMKGNISIVTQNKNMLFNANECSNNCNKVNDNPKLLYGPSRVFLKCGCNLFNKATYCVL